VLSIEHKEAQSHTIHNAILPLHNTHNSRSHNTPNVSVTVRAKQIDIDARDSSFIRMRVVSTDITSRRSSFGLLALPIYIFFRSHPTVVSKLFSDTQRSKSHHLFSCKSAARRCALFAISYCKHFLNIFQHETQNSTSRSQAQA
jgi:hypothetical protein